MFYKGEFKLADKTYKVFKCHIPVIRRRNQEEEPVFRARAEKIELILQGADDSTLGTWLADTTQKQDGKITFCFPGQNAKDKVIEFEGASLMTLLEYFTPGKLPAVLLTPPTDYFCLDLSGGEVANETQKRSLTRLLSSQKKTEMAYCMLARISAEKIKIDGVELQN
jgi:Hemolysin coregulated protein Hcp (TssD)